MNWYKWTSESKFNDWNTATSAALGLPRVGVNQNTGEPEPTKQQTVAYTSVTEVAVDDWRAPVAADIAAEYPVGLGTPSDPPPAPPEPI